MSTRNQLRPQIVIPSPQGSPVNGQSMATNITSAPTILGGMYSFTYSLSWTGTSPVGTVSVQASNDFALNAAGAVLTAGTWNTLTLSVNGTPATTIAITGNTGNGMIDVFATGAYAVRLIYTAASGAGSLTAIFNGKVS